MLLTSLKRFVLGRAGAGQSDAVARAAPVCDGNVEELSPIHAQGWIRDPGSPGRRVGYEIIIPETGEVLASGRADQFGFGLASAGIGDGAHAFWTRFAHPVGDRQRDQAVIRIEGGQQLVQTAQTRTAYEPLLHVAMDVVDNCNLRCPFCLYDYEHTRATHFMSAATLDAALRFLPYARDGEFWFSCLHEPSLHPELIAFIERVPAVYRRKLFFTTNLAKRMPPAYFDWLAGNGMHHINISIESRDPAVYERMRKGARFRIFTENWDQLVAALDRSAQPTPIRYIAMAYKSNLRELPGLARWLLDERRAAQVEIRYTFDVPYIPGEFRAAEFLDDADWAWLAGELAGFRPDQVQLHRPPTAPAPETPPETLPETPPKTAAETPTTTPTATPTAMAAPPPPPSVQSAADFLPGRVMFRLSWDGTLKVVRVLSASRGDAAREITVHEGNIADIADAAAFFADLDA